MISELKVGTVVSDKMVKELVDYEVMMKGHLKEEEDISLLLTRAYFTQSELAPKIQEIIGHGPKVCAEHEERSIRIVTLFFIKHYEPFFSHLVSNFTD